jgi:5,10-methylenetetrahydrofolate reductase
MNKKILNGTKGIITQPVYDLENAKQLLSLFDSAKSSFSDHRTSSQLILGIFPITQLRTAQFLSSHVPGIYVPQIWIDKLTVASKIGKEEERKVGLKLSSDLLEEIQKFYPKVHLMTANKFDITNELLNL